MQTCNMLQMRKNGCIVIGSASNRSKHTSCVSSNRENRHLHRIQATSNDSGDYAAFGQEWGSQMQDDDSDAGGLGWVVEQGSLLSKKAEEEAAEEALAQSIGGIHIRGNLISQMTSSTNESDRRRTFWHKNLHACASRGDAGEAETILKQMREAGHPPGPKAYNALIYSYVKSKNANGALNAMRNEVSAGIQPLPESYAAVIQGFVAEGDLETAEAVYASNRRAGVSYEKSWAAICTALFKAGNFERSMKLVEQGKGEGLLPDARLYEAIIKSYARQGDLKEALLALKEMRDKGIRPSKDHFSALLAAHALAGKAKEAEALLIAMLKATGSSTAATIGAINALLQMYLEQNLPRDELAAKITALRQLMVRGGMAFDRKGYSLLLEASIYLQDPQIGFLAMQSLKTQGRGSLQYVSDDVLGQFLMELSVNKLPADLHNVLTIMSCDQRTISSEMMSPGPNGRTFLTEWIAPTTDAEEDRERETEWLDIDGIQIDPISLCAVGPDNEPLRPSKMSVKELRAELAARQYSIQGNKSTLIKQLQKARAEAAADGSIDNTKLSKTKKVEIIISEESWSTGRLMQKNTKMDERETVDEDDVEEDEEEEEEASLATTQTVDEEDDDDFDYEDRVSAVMKAAGKFNAGSVPRAMNTRAGLKEALIILDGAIAMGGVPTEADISTLCDIIIADASEHGAANAKHLISVMESHPSTANLLTEDRKHQLLSSHLSEVSE